MKYRISTKVHSSKALLLIIFFELFGFSLFSQNIGINASGNPANASAGLDVDFNNKGLLIPRMTTAERDAINGGVFAQSLLIYNTDEKCFQIYIGTAWQNIFCDLNCTVAPAIPGIITGNTSPCESATGISYSIAQVDGAVSYNWTLPTGASITAGQGPAGIVVTFGTNSGNISVASINNCGISAAQTLAISLTAPPTTANAGADQTGASTCGLTSVTLAGNNPGVGTGAWTIISGTGGSFTDASVYNTTFSGTAGSSYTLRWTISNSPCTASYDEMNVTFNINPTTANAGSDINPACGEITATLAGNTPSPGTGTWSVISGTATITDPSSPTSGVTGLAAAGTATLRWTISYSPCNASTDDVIITTTTCFTCGTSTVDYGGQTYNTVLIGAQCWLKENLNIGTKIVSTSEQTNNATIEKYCYNNSDALCTSYGGLYQWAEAVQYINGATNTASWSPVPPGNVQGICPAGWHIPVDGEWCTLENTVGPNTDVSCSSTGGRGAGTSTGGKLKEAGTTHWSAENCGGTCNTSNFTGFGGGFRMNDASFNNNTVFGYWWVASESSATMGWYHGLSFGNAWAFRNNTNTKTTGFSIRCVKD